MTARKSPKNQKVEWCPGADSNHRHADFQSAALPTELPGREGAYPRSHGVIGDGQRAV